MGASNCNWEVGDVGVGPRRVCRDSVLTTLSTGHFTSLYMSLLTALPLKFPCMTSSLWVPVPACFQFSIVYWGWPHSRVRTRVKLNSLFLVLNLAN